jgi:hypothetical protein
MTGNDTAAVGFVSIPTDDYAAAMALRRLVDPDGHTDPTTFANGIGRYGQQIVDDEPDFLGARVRDRWGRVWERISTHDDGIWSAVDPAHDTGWEDGFYGLAAEHGPMTAEPPNPSPVNISA